MLHIGLPGANATSLGICLLSNFIQLAIWFTECAYLILILICMYTRRRPVTRTGFEGKAAVVVRYYRELLKFLHRSVNDSDVAADLAQESVARVLAVQQSGQAVAEPRALLYRTARNLVIDQHRRDNVRGQSVALDDESAVQPYLTAPQAHEPETAAISTQHTQALLNVIGALPLRCREAFILHKFDGLPQAEVARQMGISLTMVERHIKTALLACRRCQDGDGTKEAR